MPKFLSLFLFALLLIACENNADHAGIKSSAIRHYTSIDTIQIELAKAKEDSNKVKLLNDLSVVYSRNNFDLAVKLGKEGLALAEKLRWKPGIAQSNQNIGLAYLAKSDFPDANKHLTQALKINQELLNEQGIALLMGNLGELNYGMADYPKALEYYLKALKKFEELSDENGQANLMGKIGMVYYFLKDPCTLQYLNRALEMNQRLGNKSGIAENLRFIGNVYNQRASEHQKALDYYLKAVKIEEELGDKIRIARNKINIGIAYGSLNNHVKELEYKFEGLKIYKELGEKGGFANAYGNLGWSYYFIATDTNKTLDPGLAKYHVLNKRNALSLSRAYMDSAGRVFSEIGEPDFETYAVISQIDSIQGNYKDAYLNYKKSVSTKELMYGGDKTKSIAQLQMQYEYDKKEIEAKAEQERKHIIQRNIRNSFLGGLIAALIVLLVVMRQRKMTLIEKKRSDDLLLNILPGDVAEELKTKGSAEARHFDEVSVLFSDFKNFTRISEQMSAKELVEEIHACFKAFDEITERYGIEKIKTIGDSYMCAGGLPIANKTHAVDVVNAGLEMQQFIARRMAEKAALGQEPFQIRIGIHTGPVVAGIVGIRKFAYDIWGDTVNTASRMESSSEEGKINISGSTYQRVKDHFKCTYRGKIQAKNKSELDMYFVEGKL